MHATPPNFVRQALELRVPTFAPANPGASCAYAVLRQPIVRANELNPGERCSLATIGQAPRWGRRSFGSEIRRSARNAREASNYFSGLAELLNNIEQTTCVLGHGEQQIAPSQSYPTSFS